MEKNIDRLHAADNFKALGLRISIADHDFFFFFALMFRMSSAQSSFTG